MRRTLAQILKAIVSLVPQTVTATTSAETVVDTKGYDQVCWIVQSGDGTFVDETYSFQVMEDDAANGLTATAITGAVKAVTADNQTKKIQVSGLGTGSRKRYQFIRCTAAGSNKSLVVTTIALLGGSSGKLNPVQDADASV